MFGAGPLLVLVLLVVTDRERWILDSRRRPVQHERQARETCSSIISSESTGFVSGRKRYRMKALLQKPITSQVTRLSSLYWIASLVVLALPHSAIATITVVSIESSFYLNGTC
ncbi:hypothetical protein MPTK1_4g22370 [Marchantia polymorpha subsp. ruderalis]|uniref:Uncharacterized protein n=2 Tax=Marchantia polymorpha TaxID=3197 RepID=A0AAF6BCL8_MARPO|nr:hypothetical protein MARPO_0020s0007 [Marchantia polymorpha]BBN09752.1 hypothetical protein Mp_4g22370 [Marchantia polymorpha subsp. ruderalis]|eukprot:PTQ44334.1 hypothetical protein MARPO_0020s0007 [Marchantia polymorpha]